MTPVRRWPSARVPSPVPPAMAWRLALWLQRLALCAGLATLSPAHAVEPSDGAGWLARMHAAAKGANYSGTLVVSSGGGLSSSRVWHFSVGGRTYQRIESLDGRHQRILRHDDVVHTLWPQQRLAVVEDFGALAPLSTTPQAIAPQALERYELHREGSARVAGRDVAVLALLPRDALRYAQRLWADLASGLLLRADVFERAPGERAAVLESTAFSMVEIGVAVDPEVVAQLRAPADWRVLRPRQQRTTLAAEGLNLARPVPGFTLAGCVRRDMAHAGNETAVVQAVFSDGVAHVSLFVEPYRVDVHTADTLSRHGATATLRLRRGDDWLTLVGDVPPATLSAFAAAIERRRP